MTGTDLSSNHVSNHVSKPAMGKLTRALLIVAGVIVVIGGVLQMRSGWNKLTSAGDPTVDTASKKAMSAARQFLPLAKDAYQVGKVPPRQSDPAVAALLAPVFATGVVKAKVMTTADLSALADWSMANLQVGSVYITAGTGFPDVGKIPNEQATVEKIDRNVVDYAPEFGRFMDTAAIVGGGMSEAGAATLQDDANKTNAKVVEGTEKMRAGIAQTIGGDIQTVATAGLADQWRRDRLTVLIDVAPRLAKFLQPAQCSRLRDIAAKVSSLMSDAGVRTGLATFGAALKC